MPATREELKVQNKRLEADLEAQKTTNKKLSDDNDRLLLVIDRLTEQPASEVNFNYNF